MAVELLSIELVGEEVVVIAGFVGFFGFLGGIGLGEEELVLFD